MAQVNWCLKNMKNPQNLRIEYSHFTNKIGTSLHLPTEISFNVMFISQFIRAQVTTVYLYISNN